MKTTLFAAMFVLGVGFAGITVASAAEGGATSVNKAANDYTMTLDARRHCNLVQVCKRFWHPHCRMVRVCHGH